MGKLTEDQIRFLRRYGIAPSVVFDATGLPASVWKDRMKIIGLGFAVGTTPCKKGGHTIRTRAGHCIQCSPENISYYNRHRANGFVYIAQSKAANRIKVGMTTDLGERGKQLNTYRYGGAGDWRFAVTAWTNRAGEVECKTQEALRATAVSATYTKAGVDIECYELFACPLEAAKKALVANLPNGTSIKMQR